MRPIALLSMTLAIVGPCAAQGWMPLPRDMVFGLVRDADGAPVPGAEVRLLARPMGDVPAAGGADEIEVRTDERGRFRAEILLGRAYTAWAFTKREDGERVSEVVEDVFPAVPVLLDLSHVRAPTHLVVHGVGGPLAASELTWELFVHVENRVRAAGVLRPDGSAALPPLPRTIAELAVVHRDHGVLAVRDVDLSSELVEVSLAEPPGPDVLARDPDGGSTVHGASVLVPFAGALREVARTDVNGFARAPSSDRRPYLAAEGLAIGEVSGRRESRWIDPEPGYRESKAGPLPQVTAAATCPNLVSGFSVTGRLLVQEGDPAPDCRLVTVETALEAHPWRTVESRYSMARRVSATAADGRWRLPSLLAEHPPVFSIIVGDGSARRLPEAWTARGLVPVVHHAIRGDENGVGEVDLGDFALIDCVPIRLVVRAADGAPASHARFVLHDGLESVVHGRPTPRWTTTDRGGEATFLVAPRRSVALGVTHAGGLAVAAIEAHVGEVLAEPIELTVRVPVPRAVRGRAVDAMGRAVSEERVRVVGTPLGWKQTSPWSPRVDLAAPVHVDHPRLTVGGLSDAERYAWILGEIVRRSTESLLTASDGTFEFSLPDLPMNLRIGSWRDFTRCWEGNHVPDDEVVIQVPHR